MCVCARACVHTHTHIYHSEGRTREIKRDTKKADNVCFVLFCFLINIYGNFSLGLFLTLSITVGLLGDKSVFPILVLGKQET